MCLVSLVLDMNTWLIDLINRLNTLTFKTFTTSGTHILAHGSLILLQLPLYLLVLILKGKNTGLLLLTLTIAGLALHAWLFIEIQPKEVVLTKLDKNNEPIFKKFKHFILYQFSSSNTYEYL